MHVSWVTLRVVWHLTTGGPLPTLHIYEEETVDDQHASKCWFKGQLKQEVDHKPSIPQIIYTFLVTFMSKHC